MRKLPRVRDVKSWLSDRRVPAASKLLGLGALLYAVSPLDVIPDALPLLGWLDDVGVLGAAVAWYLSRIARHAERSRAEEAARA